MLALFRFQSYQCYSRISSRMSSLHGVSTCTALWPCLSTWTCLWTTDWNLWSIARSFKIIGLFSQKIIFYVYDCFLAEVTTIFVETNHNAELVLTHAKNLPHLIHLILLDPPIGSLEALARTSGVKVIQYKKVLVWLQYKKSWAALPFS